MFWEVITLSSDSAPRLGMGEAVRTSLDEARARRSSVQVNGTGASPTTPQQAAQDDVVPVGFDETVLRHLIELDVCFR